jgi:hypothetical protein
MFLKPFVSFPDGRTSIYSRTINCTYDITFRNSASFNSFKCLIAFTERIFMVSHKLYYLSNIMR